MHRPPLAVLLLVSRGARRATLGATFKRVPRRLAVRRQNDETPGNPGVS